MELSGLNPFIRYAKLHFVYHASDSHSVCYDCRLFYVLSGEGSVLIGEEKHRISRGTAIYLPPASRYRFDFAMPGDVRIYVINFDTTDARSDMTSSLGTATEESYDEARVIRAPQPPELKDAIVCSSGVEVESNIASCIELFLGGTANYKHLASANLKLALIGMLNRNKASGADYRLVEGVEEYIRRNYHDAHLSNAEIAAAFSYHPYYISRLMLRHTGMTLREYITDYRLRMAADYLTTTTLSISEISERTGFSSYTYFIKVFREKQGVPPLKYRKSNVGRI